MNSGSFFHEFDGRFFEKNQEQPNNLQSQRDASKGEHFVQFFESDDFLLNSLYEFTRGGLDTGDALIVVATAERCRLLKESLEKSGFDVSAALNSNQFIVLDAHAMLEKFMVRGVPDAALFAKFAGELITLAAQNNRQVKIFGEMVAILLAEGNQKAAVRLEELWNELQKTHSFSLFCAYPIHAFDGGMLSPLLEEVCAGHTRVIPDESFTSINDDNNRSRKITQLQQQARSLEREIEERRKAEESLCRVKEELEIQVEDLRRLHEISLRLTGTLNVNQILQEVLEAVLVVQKTDMGLLSLCTTEEDQGLTLKVQSGFDAEFQKTFEFISPGSGACGMCFETKRQVIIEDTETDPTFAEHREAARQAGFRAVHSTPLVTREGNITGVLSVHFRRPHRPHEREMRLMDLYAQMAADIIEKARLLEREQEARRRAEEANQMKDQFLATISHELRTPLNAIVGWSHLLRENRLDKAKTKRAVHAIDRNARLQAQLIEDLLDVSRIISGKLCLKTEPIDLYLIMEETVNSVRAAAKSKNIRLLTEWDVPTTPVEADPARLQQVVWNLLTNAIKFTEPGGRVEISLSSDESGSVNISVKDTGKGISPDVLPFIFDNFRQGDGSSTRCYGGMGLGLAIVRHLTELHGGTIEAHSEGEGKGATFIVKLPQNASPNPND